MMKKDKQVNILLSEEIFLKYSKMCQFQGSYASTKARELIVSWVNSNSDLWNSVLEKERNEELSIAFKANESSDSKIDEFDFDLLKSKI